MKDAFLVVETHTVHINPTGVKSHCTLKILDKQNV